VTVGREYLSARKYLEPGLNRLLAQQKILDCTCNELCVAYNVSLSDAFVIG
jgi:hypothetical protein